MRYRHQHAKMLDPYPTNRSRSSANHPAASRWAAARAALRAASKTEAVVAHSAARDVAATFAQQRLWFIEQLNPATSLHNLPIACRLSGHLSVDALEQAATQVVDRHAVLRTRLHANGGTLMQSVCNPSPRLLSYVDLEQLAVDKRHDELDRLMSAVAQQPFALTDPLLPRLVLARMDAMEHRLLLCFHHLVFDGWSFAIFMRELGAVYNVLLAGDRGGPNALALQYSDYALWQRAPTQVRANDESRAFWREALRSPPEALRMHTDNFGRSIASGRGAVLPFTLSLEQSAKLLALCDSDGVSLFVLLLSIFNVFLHRFTGRDDLWVGYPVANRPRAELSDVIGVFVNTVVIRTRLNGSATFRQVLADVQRTVNDNLAHQALPYQHVVQEVAPQRDSSGGSLLQIMFAHQNLPSADCHFEGMSVELTNVHNGAAGAELTLFSWLKHGQIGGLWEWDMGLYEQLDVADWATHFSTLVDSVVNDPNTPVESLRLMENAALHALLQSGAGSVSNADPTLTIHAAFEQQVRRTPNATAIVDAAGAMTYAELDGRAAELAPKIAFQNKASRPYVGLCMSPSRDLVIAMLAILKAGLAYVPLGCNEPVHRLRQIINAANITNVITDAALATQVREADAMPMLVVDSEVVATSPTRISPLQRVNVDALACVMFTSGSSGQPKGVCIAHRGVTRLVVDAHYLTIGTSDVLLQLAPVAFDASTFEIWGALLNGARLVLPAHERVSLRDIAELIGTYSVSVLWLTTGLFEAMVDEQLPALGHLRQLLVGGDVLSMHHAQRFVESHPACTLLNCYGPTENTTFTTVHVVNGATSFNGTSMPIGRAVNGTQVYVLDHNYQPVPRGVVGEAFVAGQGLMRGYLVDGSPDNGCLLKNPHSAAPDSMMYGTGDRVRQRHDGELEFIGRIDEQVKIRGHRVELAEVMAALNRCPGVTRGVVVVAGNSAASRRLIAFVTISPSGDSESKLASLIRASMQQQLPAPLVPTEIRIVSALPLTQSGKFDRAKLQRLTLVANPTAEHRAGWNSPNGEMETVIASVFASALGTQAVARNDNLFELGGHSLLALRVIAALEAALSSRIPLVSLFAHPTPASLALALTEFANDLVVAKASAPLPSSLVEIKRGTSARPLFVLPGGHGGMVEMTLYARLMEQVGGDLMVYGIIARGLDGRLEPHDSVQATAAAYLAEIREVQPHGPYSLCGECVGGVIALEMAQQLRAKGERVASLLLLDTWLPTDAGVRHFRFIEQPRTLLFVRARLIRAACADLCGVLADHITRRPRTSLYRRCFYAVNVALTLMRIASAWTRKVVNPEKVEADQEAISAAESKYVRTALAYRAQPYSDVINVVACASNAKRGIFRDWATIAGDHLSTHMVPGTHDTYIQKFTEQTADAVRTCLDQAHARSKQLTSVAPAGSVDHGGY